MNKPQAYWVVMALVLSALTSKAETRYVWQQSPSPAPPYSTWAPFRPSLGISRVGSQVRIAWPAAASDWALRRALEVQGPYNDPGLPVTTEGSESVAYDNLATGAGFYRLQRQP